MDCVYPYQYNVHDTTYYYYEPPLVEMVDSGMMMGVSPPMMSPATPPGHLQPLYMPDHNNNHTHSEYEVSRLDIIDYIRVFSLYILVIFSTDFEEVFQIIG